jgi:hypothetical protein
MKPGSAEALRCSGWLGSSSGKQKSALKAFAILMDALRSHRHKWDERERRAYSRVYHFIYPSCARRAKKRRA